MMMTKRTQKNRLITLLGLALLGLALLAPLAPLHAQGPDPQAPNAQRYENAGLGVSFDLPAGWQVWIDNNMLVAAAPADMPAVQRGEIPQGLAVRILVGSFNELGINDAMEIPSLLRRLVPGGASEPQAVQWGSASGYQALATLPEGLTTRVGLLAISGGRVAVVRGLAATATWNGGAGAQFDTLTASLEFAVPQREADYLEELPANDGGVLWHFQAAPPESGRIVRAGGIVYDQFDVMYVAAGPGGLMTLDMENGNRINFIGPWYDGDFVDVAIGPDTRLVLANAAPGSGQGLMVVDRAGNYYTGWGAQGDGAGQFAPGMPQTVAIDGEGAIWTVSEGHNTGAARRLYKFDNVGNLLLEVDLQQINPDLRDVHITYNLNTGGLYMVGSGGAINLVDANGQPLVTNLALESLQGTTPTDIATAPNNNIVVALDAPGLDGFGFMEISASGVLLDLFGAPMNDARAFLPGEYSQPRGLVVGPDGTSYFAETDVESGYTQVQRFTFTGDGILPLGSEVASAPPPEALSGVSAGSSDPANGGGVISYGQTVTGALNNRYPSHAWTFSGQAGDHIRISMIDPTGAGLIDPRLVLLNAEGREIAANDDVGEIHPEGMMPRDAMIDFFLPSTGTFTIQAGRFGGRGQYILRLEFLGQ